MRTRTGLPFSGCDGGRLRTAPIRDLKRPSGTMGTGTGPRVFGPAERTGGTPDLRIQDQPGRERGLRTDALPPAQKELRLRRGRAGPGFGPGAANPAWTQRFGAWTCQAEPRLRPRILPARFLVLRCLENAKAGKRNASSESAERRTARASALSGSLRGHRKGFGPDGLRRMRGQDLSWLPRLETAHRERPASAEPDAKGQWGPAAMPAPITVSGLRQRPHPFAFPRSGHAASLLRVLSSSRLRVK
jgi:hypothetical protein